MINNINMKAQVDAYLLRALKEDITNEDVTTNSILKTQMMGRAELYCKEGGILSGIKVFERVFSLLGNVDFKSKYKDGNPIKKDSIIGVLEGDLRVILSGERTALNYIQRMSGISTMTARYVEMLKGTKTKLLDTRKTTPNMRLFEKYAVKIGGGYNHRYNLSDGILLKDNHIKAAGGLSKAIRLAREYAPFIRKIEVEVENLTMVKEALEAGADIIMLDNMDNHTMKKAVDLIGGQALTECSGNITLDRLKKVALIGIDFVSCGALTHSAPILDFSLNII